MLETLTYTLVTCGVLFLVLPVMIHMYARMATMGYYAGRDQYRKKRAEQLSKAFDAYTNETRHKRRTEPGDN